MGQARAVRAATDGYALRLDAVGAEGVFRALDEVEVGEDLLLHVVVAVIDLGLGCAVAVNFVEARGAVGKESLFLLKALAVVVADDVAQRRLGHAAAHLGQVEKALVTHNIKMACSKRKGLRLLRCLREPGAGDNRPGVIHMPDVEAAAAWLSSVEGNILVTTGSKELAAYTRIRDYGQRIYARILPSAEAVAQCRSLGFEGRHIIAMQGPFSEEMNLAQLREYGCAYLVTKDGGAAGGFPEKIKAAHRAGAAAVVIDRPGSGEGISLDEIKGQLKEWMDHEKKGSIYG